MISNDIRARNNVLGTWFALAAILMLFTALTSAYVFRRGLDADWQAMRAPGLIFFSTAVLLASSATLEISRRSARVVRWLVATGLLGFAFVAGQLLVWNQLATAGVRLATTTHSSFFYLLTAVHALHLLGGIVALSRCWPGGAAAIALYWHFLTGLWLYILVILFVWR